MHHVSVRRGSALFTTLVQQVLIWTLGPILFVLLLFGSNSKSLMVYGLTIVVIFSIPVLAFAYWTWLLCRALRTGGHPAKLVLLALLLLPTLAMFAGAVYVPAEFIRRKAQSLNGKSSPPTSSTFPPASVMRTHSLPLIGRVTRHALVPEMASAVMVGASGS